MINVLERGDKHEKTVTCRRSVLLVSTLPEDLQDAVIHHEQEACRRIRMRWTSVMLAMSATRGTTRVMDISSVPWTCILRVDAVEEEGIEPRIVLLFLG